MVEGKPQNYGFVGFVPV